MICSALAETAHTPGPWKYHIGRGIDPRFHVQTEGGYQIVETPKTGIACGIREANEANARLIAAAPELLAACKAALDGLLPCNPQDPELLNYETCPPGHRNECGHCFRRRQIEAAIAKAEVQP